MDNSLISYVITMKNMLKKIVINRYKFHKIRKEICANRLIKSMQTKLLPLIAFKQATNPKVI